MLTLEQVRNKSAARLMGLYPIVGQAAIKLIERCYARGVPIVITQGLRTISEQNELYAKGRTAPGPKVTNAKGGYSNHNFGMAIDFALLQSDGRSVSWTMNKDWMTVVEEAKALGFSWGGDWRDFKDYPHLEMTFGLTTAELRAGKKPPQASMDAVLSKIKKGEVTMNKVDANDIIDKFLKPAYGAAKTDKERTEIGRLADSLRVASGQPKQNG
ncbi:Peptidoglycan L-alanyl-D-glutamate endopeptidase CwlK precursor [compost metagenome]